MAKRPNRTLYLCGPINGRTDRDAKVWREVIEGKWDGETLNPMRRDYRGRELEPGIAEEIVQGDLDDLNNSDAVIVFYDKASVGTSMEIFYAKHFLGLFIVVIDATGGLPLSPWLVHHSDLQTPDIDAALAAVDKHLQARSPVRRPIPDIGAASAAMDRAADAYRALDGLLASWFPALSRERQALAEVLRHLSDASAALGPIAHAMAIKPCTNAAHMGEHACTNRSQCWEPCGELGHSMQHARVSRADA